MSVESPYGIPLQREPYLPTFNSTLLQMRGTTGLRNDTLAVLTGVGSYLRSLHFRMHTSGPARYRRPPAAAVRTMSRRKAAGSRRTKRHSLRKPGPRAIMRGNRDDSPFGPISGYHLFLREWLG